MKWKWNALAKNAIEIGLIFLIFYIFGAWPVPDSNEPHYIGKAIHFWNPNWIVNDDFLESKDAHVVFYWAFGWLTFFLSPTGMAWTGRIFCWAMMAWSWRRLSFTLIPVRWMAIPSALALAYYVDSFHMAGEWILGGVEGKTFAFPFLFLGLEAMLRGRWGRTWILLGIASAFHVLVGGWSVLIALIVCLFTDCRRVVRAPQFWGGLLLGGAISLLGLVPALLLDRGTDPETIRQARQIYVFGRVYHHLVPTLLPWTFIARFYLLSTIWLLFCRFRRKGGRQHRFDCFVWVTLALSLIGLILSWELRENKELAAEILRFYWFRLSDIMVPMGVALGASWQLLRHAKRFFTEKEKLGLPEPVQWISWIGLSLGLYFVVDYWVFHNRLYLTVLPESGIPWAITLILLGLTLIYLQSRKMWRQTCLWGQVGFFCTIVLLAPLDSLKSLGDQRTAVLYARTEPANALNAYYWMDACRWIAKTENTPKTAKFLVPYDRVTFKWHSGRSDVGVRKDIPQDAQSVVQWHRRMEDLFSYQDVSGKTVWDRSLTVQLWWKSPEELEQLRDRYGFEYILCPAYPELNKHRALKTVYQNEYFRVYKIHPLHQ